MVGFDKVRYEGIDRDTFQGVLSRIAEPLVKDPTRLFVKVILTCHVLRCTHRTNRCSFRYRSRTLSRIFPYQLTICSSVMPFFDPFNGAGPFLPLVDERDSVCSAVGTFNCVSKKLVTRTMSLFVSALHIVKRVLTKDKMCCTYQSCSATIEAPPAEVKATSLKVAHCDSRTSVSLK